MKKIYLFFYLFLFFYNKTSAQNTPIAILTAFPPEIGEFQKNIKQRNDTVIASINFMRGQLEGKAVVIAMTGVGKVNAALTTTLLLTHFKPKAVFFSGIAGGLNPTLFPGDMVLAQSTIYHDFGKLTNDGMTLWATKPSGGQENNPLYFPADSLLLLKAVKASERTNFQSLSTENRKVVVLKGIVATGDIFVNNQARNDEIRKATKADATEMEGAAVAHVCYQLKTPCLIIRSISDKADGSAHDTIKQFGETAGANSARLIFTMLND